VLNNALREILTLTVEAFSKNDLTEKILINSWRMKSLKSI
jgi:hypothetical protein